MAAAVVLGIASALFSMSMGIGAGGAYLVTLFGGTVLLILVGGRHRAFHVVIFGASLFASVLLADLSAPFHFTASEAVLLLAISTIPPLGVAAIATRFLG